MHCPRILTNTVAVAFCAFIAVPLLTIAPQAQAAEVCCACKPLADDLNKTCLLTEDTQLGSSTDCTALPEKANLGGSWTCESTPLNETKCKTVSSGGICINRPMNAADAKNIRTGETIVSAPKKQDTTPKALPFSLNINIPGFNASTVTPSLLADYLVAFFRYGISILAIVSTIAFIYGAFLYLVGSALPSIVKGKTVMKDAIVGMIIVLASTAILRTLNPSLLTLKLLEIKEVQTTSYSNHLVGNSLAPDVLAELGMPPAANIRPTNLAIPTGECPGSDKKYKEDGIAVVGPGQRMSRHLFTIGWRGQGITDELIQHYLAEQTRTGIPAAVIIAQIFNESGGSCPVINLFGNPAVCGGLHSKNYNFGGIGCTQRQVPSDACAHIAFPVATIGYKGKSVPSDNNHVNKYWNKHVSPNCVRILNEGATRSTYTNCGPRCYPQKSHASTRINGKEVWFQSVQCSRKFNSVQEFLSSHLSFVKACLPYNDSVYKFAYCIGASTYAGQTGAKAIILAEIIERNCLCDPATDSLGCVRDKQFELDLVNNVIKKTNLFKLYSAGKPLDDEIVQALWEKTQGRLTPGPGDVIREETAQQEAEEEAETEEEEETPA
jgi:hypothetical protein